MTSQIFETFTHNIGRNSATKVVQDRPFSLTLIYLSPRRGHFNGPRSVSYSTFDL